MITDTVSSLTIDTNKMNFSSEHLFAHNIPPMKLLHAHMKDDVLDDNEFLPNFLYF